MKATQLERAAPRSVARGGLLALLSVAPVMLGGTALGQGSAFATRVMGYAPAPGQFVQAAQFNDPLRGLGAPIGGGTLAPDNSKVVSLGGFGGWITLGFDHRVMDDPRNPLGLDAIVFGNASYVGGNPNRRFAEAATIEIAVDANGNGLADDAWYVVRGPQIPAVPWAAWTVRTWDDNFGDPTFPPGEPGWMPAGRAGQWQTQGFMLPASVLGGPVVQNPLGLSSTSEGVWGIGDHTPTLLRGDLDGDNVVDDPGVSPAVFYTVPDDPFVVGISPGSGGGDGFDIAWAVDEVSGLPANLAGFDFIRLTTAIDSVGPILGEVSAEIGGVADVRATLGKRVVGPRIVGPP